MKALVRIGLFALQALSMLLLLWGVLWGLMTLFGVVLLIGWGSRGFIHCDDEAVGSADAPVRRDVSRTSLGVGG